MRRWLGSAIAVLCALSASAVLAQSVTVRSGEHGAFTRLVLSFETGALWTAGQTSDGYAITFEDADPLRVDTGRVFDLITRDRVADIRVQTELNAVEIDLACACWADISAFGERAIVVDIRPGLAPPDALFQAMLRWPAETAPVAATVSPPAMAVPDPETVGPLKPLPIARIQRQVTSSLVSPEQDLPFSRRPHLEDAPSAAENPSGAVDTLAAEVARAVAQGLLQKDADPTALTEAVAPPGQVRNLNVDTAIDQALGLTGSPARIIDSSGTCIPVGRINVLDWAPPGGIDGLGELRRDAIAEDGSLTETGVLTLARAYIHLGFGAEARALARTLPSGLDRTVIMALSDIADHGRSEADILADQFACSAEAAVWRALARPFGADDLPRDVDPMLAVFSALPETLRIHLGPVMAERLRQAGLPEESRIALNTVARGGNVSIEQTLTVARLDLTGTRAEDARIRLETLASGTGLTAADALLELLEDAARRQVAPEPAWVDDAPSLVRATRGTDVAQALAQAGLRGALALNRFDDVRRALADGPPELSDDDRLSLFLELADGVVARGPDADFLKTEILLRDRIPIVEQPRPLRMAFLARNMALGLPDRALDYAPEALNNDEERVLVGRALGAIGQVEAALSVLDGLQGQDAVAERARILSVAGRSAEAADQFFAVDDAGNGRREAIRAANWDVVLPSDTSETLAGEAALASPDPESVSSTGNAALLSRMADRRTLLVDLLALTELE